MTHNGYLEERGRFSSSPSSCLKLSGTLEEGLYLCDFDVIYFETRVRMGLMSIEDLLYCDRSKCIFAVCTLQISIRLLLVCHKLVAHLPCLVLAPLLGTYHEAPSICATLSSIRRGCITTTVTYRTDYFLKQYPMVLLDSLMMPEDLGDFEICWLLCFHRENEKLVLRRHSKELDFCECQAADKIVCHDVVEPSGRF